MYPLLIRTGWPVRPATLVLLLFASPVFAQTVRSDTVDERIAKQRGRQLQLLIRNRTPAKQLRQQDFSYADLRGLDLLRPSLSERLAGLSFSQAYTSPAYQNGEDLFTAVLGEVRLTGARLDRVDLHGAYLSKANLRAASLRGTDLRRAVLNQAVLVGADLRNANLARARLFAADLRNADLSGADLTGANLRDADLRGARLSGARLAGAILIGARTGIGDANPRPPK